MISKSKKTKLKSKKKFTFKNPALVIVVVILVAGGIFFAFQTFAADGTVSATAVGKDAYGCPKNYTKRPNLQQGSSGPCVKTLQNILNKLYPVVVSSPSPSLAVDGAFGPKTKNAVVLFAALCNQRKSCTHPWEPGSGGAIRTDGVVDVNYWYRLEQHLYCVFWPAVEYCK